VTRIVPDAIVEVVRHRASGFCEYCRVPEALTGFTLQVDHVIARSHGGTDDVDNLAWACAICNLYKGTNLSGFEPATKTIIRLYNPRQDRWAEHFRLNDGVLEPLSGIAGVTIRLLRMNQRETVLARKIYAMCFPTSNG